ncbi:MAG: 5-amino-6-(D-ribitylamino)uracil--L-tyrosine 4-hydroxyphenyl transferase CofH, partial [Myxococcales bacterium]|nr:5-amino-6-(D-ribitylamino)uracil--L-tyrosine 4-hydroxyphenyl transferase CofH [Myxococcales bacterium]
AADELRARQAGPHVTYVVNRNINFTNVCIKRCGFCAFSRTRRSEEGYLLDVDEIVRRAVEAADLGATEVCLQAGLAPRLDGGFYVALIRAVKRAAPGLHVHALSPEEIKYGAHRARRSIRDFLIELREAGLGTLPGTSAEILDDAVRARIAPGRITTAEWLDVVRTAHAVGLRTTATMMFGHVETHADRLRHLETLRDVQRDTGGFTELVPLSFVHAEAPMFARDTAGVPPGPSGVDVVRTHAIARVMLGADVPNLQVSWVKEGLRMAEWLLTCGVNDLGGTLINESISTAAGAEHGQLATPAQLRRTARAAGRVPAERTTLYALRRVFDGADADGGTDAGAGDDRGDALDRVADPAAAFGSYRALTRDPRFRFGGAPRPGHGEQIVEVGRPVEVEGEAVAIDGGEPQAVVAGAGDVALVAVGVAEAGGGGGQPYGQRVGPQLFAIRRRDDIRAVEGAAQVGDVGAAEVR